MGSYRIRARSCEGVNGACNGRCFSRDEIGDETSKADRKVVVLLFDRDYLRDDECAELTFSADTDRDGWFADYDDVGLRILDGNAEPVARELSERDRVTAESDAVDVLERCDVLERWDADDLEDYQLAAGGM